MSVTATPDSDSVRAQIAEVCTCGHGRDEHDDGTAHCGANEWCNCDAFVPVCAEPMRGGPNSGLPCALPRGHNDGIHNRPAAPSEPPAADSPTTGTCGCRCGHGEPSHRHPEGLCAACQLCTGFRPAAPSPVDTEPPAETQQDDERRWNQVLWLRIREAFWAAGLAALDSDVAHVAEGVEQYVTERLAARPSADTETLADRFMSSALDNIGAFDGSNNEARDRAYVRAELVALLDGLR